jgi:hypothetical protein
MYLSSHLPSRSIMHDGDMLIDDGVYADFCQEGIWKSLDDMEETLGARK